MDLIHVTMEEYDIIKKVIIDGSDYAKITITDGVRKAVLIVQDSYEDNCMETK